MNLKGRHFLTLLDYSPEEIRYLLDLAKDFKAKKHKGIEHKYLSGKNIVLLFEKTSTRTRCAFEVAGLDLGMGVTYLDPGSSQMGKKESIADTAKVTKDGAVVGGNKIKMGLPITLEGEKYRFNGTISDVRVTSDIELENSDKDNNLT